jgi:hypothetical protein
MQTPRDNEEDIITGTRPRGECFFFTRRGDQEKE